jgi:rSAM/selenodomain-associated transferase 2
MTHFSLIVPVLDEAAQIQQRLEPLQDLRQCGHEVIVVDGGSVDGSLPLAQSLADRILTVARGRARQMNAGARVASNEWLLFLHLDTELPESAAQIMANDIAASGREWGWFDVQLANPGWPYRVIAWHMNRRARLTRVCTGDQALFVRRCCFEALGGFPDLPLMEDVALSKRLRRRSAPLVLSAPVTTSARRWEQHGVLRTVLLMWRLRLLYWLGVSPERLVNHYYPRRP